MRRGSIRTISPSSFYPREADSGHLVVEGRFPEAAIENLREKGHRVQVDGDWTLGRMTAASKTDEYLRAGANARFMQGYALGR